MTGTYSGFGKRKTSQAEAIPGSAQSPNNAGGYAWTLDDWARLERFLILGSEGGTYYVAERELTSENVGVLRRCLDLDGPRAVDTIRAVSESGRAPKNTPAIFALAVAASEGDEATRRAALDALPAVCRTGTHLFAFAALVEEQRGWGRSLRRAIGAWYQRDDVASLAYQVVKYRQREGWTHRDLLRLSHPKAPTRSHNALYRWIVSNGDATVEDDSLRVVEAFARAQAAPTAKETARLLGEYGNLLPREALLPEHLTSREVWSALLEADMPMTALIRNLPVMTRVGLLEQGGDAVRRVAAQLGDGQRLRNARVHPLALLAAVATYSKGRSLRGQGAWQPVPAIVDALDAAFYLAFKAVEPTGERVQLALDVSGSMAVPINGMPAVSCRAGAAAMALVTAAVEPHHSVVAFADGRTQRTAGVYQGIGGRWGGQSKLEPLALSRRQRLDDVLKATDAIPMGGTDCALPIVEAMKKKEAVDAFVIYTDSETWFGDIHPAQALRAYREQSGIAAKLIVVGMASNAFTIADPDDPGQLDVVGFDTAAPALIGDVIRGPRPQSL